MSCDSSRYPPIDLGDIDDSYAVAIGRVPARSRVLEVGFVDGAMDSILTAMGCRVWRVRLDPDLDEDAPSSSDKVFETRVGLDSVDLTGLVEEVGDAKFDVILLLDVLQHVRKPATLLAALSKVLDDRGWGVISVPNVAHGSRRLDLLRGRFHQDATTSRRAQLRFFDRHGIDELLDEAGWERFELTKVVRAIDTAEFCEEAERELVRQLATDTDALTYQFVLSVAPRGSQVLVQPPVLPTAIAQAALIEARDRIRALEEEVRQLRGEHLPDLREQLEEIRGNAIERKGKLKDILVAIRDL